MPIEIYRCEYCGDDFEDEHECRLHELTCEDNPYRKPKYPPPFTASPCRCCARSWMAGSRLHRPPDCPEPYMREWGWVINTESQSSIFWNGDEEAGITVCPLFRADTSWFWNELDAAARRLIPREQRP